jgi:hypothetical protein
MKILFLDIDGVLNNAAFFERIPHKDASTMELFDPDSVKLLNKIVEKSGAVFVVSSTWRMLHPIPELRRIFDKNDVRGTILDYTPRLLPKKLSMWLERGHEIQAWIDAQPEKPERFVILDDDSDMAHLSPYLVQTSWAKGLREEHVEPALKLLMK